MIDMETLDVTPFCVILTIGCVTFDPYGEGVIEKLELRPTIEEQTERFSRTINEGTLRWWSEQSSDAIEEAMSDRGRISFKECMEKLYKFCWNRNAVWSNGAAFDVVVAETAFTQLDMRIPWPFYTVRDTRTLYDIAKVKLSDGGKKTSHKAVEDATRQAELVQKAFKKITVS